MNLSRFFTLDEMTFSTTARQAGIENRPEPGEIECLRGLCARLLDPLREGVGRAIKINSGYRGPTLNQRLGGATRSQHMVGQAADIQAPGMAVVELFKTVIRLGLPFDQLIYEANGAARWVHVSHAPGSNRGEILVAQFGPDGRPRGYPRIDVAQALAMTEPVTRSGGPLAEPGYVELADEPEHDAPAERCAPDNASGLDDIATRDDRAAPESRRPRSG